MKYTDLALCSACSLIKIAMYINKTEDEGANSLVK